MHAHCCCRPGRSGVGKRPGGSLPLSRAASPASGCLGPRIIESLYILGDPQSLPLFEGLLVAGHTEADTDRCEVTRALVAVRKLTGRVAPSVKFGEADTAEVRSALDEAEQRFEAERDRIEPVTVI